MKLCMNFQSLFSRLQAGTPFLRDLGKKFRILDLTGNDGEKQLSTRGSLVFVDFSKARRKKGCGGQRVDEN